MKVINNFLKTTEEFLIKSPLPIKNIRYFRIAVYSLLFFKILFLWPAIPTFYHQAFADFSSNPFAFFNINQLIFLPLFQQNIQYLFGFFLIIILLAIFLRKNIWLAVVVFIINLNYLSLTHLAINGSDMLLSFFIFLIIFISEKKQQNENVIMLSNGAWWMLKLNVCFVYFINGYGKLIKSIWLTGKAMEAVWQLDYYSNPHFVPQWFLNPTFCLITGWLIIAFELAFPFLIWFKAFKKWLIPIGIIFHLLIAVFLSLPDFGLTMVAVYLLFIDFEDPLLANAKKAI